MTTTETWKSVPSHKGVYEVSDTGRVRALPRFITKRNKAGVSTVYRQPARVLKAGLATMGYLTVCLQGRTHYVHRLVLEAFRGPCPRGYVGCHGDNCRTNNAIGNLRWDSRQGNEADKEDHGTRQRGEHVITSKLKARDVSRIRSLVAQGMTQRAVAKEYGVHPNHVSAIVRRVWWKHV